jgi:hypothetical protein
MSPLSCFVRLEMKLITSISLKNLQYSFAPSSKIAFLFVDKYCGDLA